MASSHIDPSAPSPSPSPSPTGSNVVQGIDVAGTPVVVPEDPFGVLQPYDTAAKVLSQPALIMTRQIEMMNGKRLISTQKRRVSWKEILTSTYYLDTF